MDVDFLREVISFVTLIVAVQDGLGDLALDLEAAWSVLKFLETYAFPSWRFSKHD